MRILPIAIVLLLSGCAAIPQQTSSTSKVLEIPPVPTLSPEAKKDAKQAYVELVQSYKELRVIAKELGDIHFVIFSY